MSFILKQKVPDVDDYDGRFPSVDPITMTLADIILSPFPSSSRRGTCLTARPRSTGY